MGPCTGVHQAPGRSLPAGPAPRTSPEESRKHQRANPTGKRTVASMQDLTPAAPQPRSNTAIDSTCAVCGNMFTTPAAVQR